MEQNQTGKKKTSLHMWLMVACCVLPIAIIGILWLAGVRSTYLTLGLVLVCPLAHVTMLLFMNKKGGDSTEHHH
jgi:hypothetical protein